MTETRLIARFDQIGRSEADSVGGKCAGLGELIRAGIPVPPGFAVTTEAFRRHLLENNLSPAGLDSAAIRRGIAEAPVPAALAAAITDAYAALGEVTGGTPAVAVRSSAVGEDGRAASFAGQQETYLWVSGAEEVIANVRRCWASLYTSQAVSYREHFGADAVRATGVGVQLMVDARVAGVMFTLDPVTGDRSQIAVNSAWGLGLAVANGEVTPDEFLVDKVIMEITRRRVTDKPFEYLAAGSQGVARAEVSGDRRSSSSLTDAELLELSGVGKRVEAHMGSAQDIEWAIDRRLPFPAGLFVLQSRPETVWANKPTAAPAPLPASPIGLLTSMMRDMIRPAGAPPSTDAPQPPPSN